MIEVIEDFNEDAINESSEGKKLTDFAFCGKKEDFLGKIDYLARIAEKEAWSFNEKNNSILLSYFNNTFTQCYKENKIMYAEDEKSCCFNTGLLTSHGHDIIALFNRNANPNLMLEWYFKGFCEKSDRDFMDAFPEVPEVAEYTQNFIEYYFNPKKNIEINSNHILDENWENISKIIPLDKSIVKVLLFGVLEEAKKKVKRNPRLVVPQLYRNEIVYLLPINIPIGSEKFITFALAVQETESGQYRANTIFTLDVAYKKARMLMKPDSSWLSEQTVLKYLEDIHRN
ncbi:MAG: DUF3825 domain-containing protein [Erysipelotrichales bacterium]|nr:DUF3825 domain-containing protein [Erysipelotrichales bacterium]